MNSVNFCYALEAELIELLEVCDVISFQSLRSCPQSLQKSPAGW